MFNVQSLLSLTAFDIVKWFLVAGLVMYSAFAFVITRQVAVMSESIEDELNTLIILFAWIHLGVAILLTVIAMVVL